MSLEPIKIPKKTKPVINEQTGDIDEELEGGFELSEKRKERKSEVQELIDYLHYNYGFRYNLFTSEIEFTSEKSKQWQAMDDRELNSVVLKAQLDGFKTSERTVSRILVSDHTPSYHPIKEYFAALPKWDGKDHIAAYCKRLVVKDYAEHVTPLVRRWLLAAAACALGYISRNEVCLVLSGGQGLGKTTWLDHLCPPSLADYRVTGPIVPDKKDANTANMLAEKWFVNIDDQLENLFGKDANALKNIITADDVTNRKAYARMTKRRARVATFMASVNSTNFLTDTQNRRYLCFDVIDIDRKTRLPDITPLWAQVKHLLEKGESARFSAEEQNIINKMNLDFAEITLEMELLQQYITHPDNKLLMGFGATNTQILRYLSLKVPGTLRLSQRVLGRALTRLGYDLKSARNEAGIPTKMYQICLKTESDRTYFM